MVSKKNFFIILILFGYLHWFCFYFFSDFYSYNDKIPVSEINFDNIESEFTLNISLDKIKQKYYKNDKELFKQIIKEKNIRTDKIFSFNTFIENDWYKEIEYLNIISESLRSKTMPFHVDGLSKIVYSTNKFLGSPIYTLSPQIFLLNYFTVDTFVVLNLFFMFTVGMIGLFLIYKEFKLSYIPLIFLYLIFNFNGYFITKYSYYGASQLGYFILPFLFFGLIKILKNENKNHETAWSIFTGLSLSLILLQGSLHLYIECLTLILFWSIFNFRKWRVSLIIIVANFTTSFFRLFPAFLSYGTEANPHVYKGFGGYRDLSIFTESLLSLKTNFEFPGFWHELSMYVSLPGFLLVLFFGLFFYFFEKNNSNKLVWKGLAFPMLLIFLISFHKLKFLVIPNFIPLFNAESMTTRYIIIPVLFLTIVAAINLNVYLKNNSKKVKIPLLTVSLILFFLLMNYSRNWRNNVSSSEIQWADSLNLRGWEFLNDKINLTITNDYSDHLYIYSIYFSLFISIIFYILFSYLFVKFYKR